MTSCVPATSAATVRSVRCASCGVDDDKVVDTRPAEDGCSIRRRRECLGCGRRITTFERVEEVPLVVAKRSGGSEPFDREKVVRGVTAAATGRPISGEQIEELSLDLEERFRISGPEVSSDEIGIAVLAWLRELDQVAFVRFASVYRDFKDVAEFYRELEAMNLASSRRSRGEGATDDQKAGISSSQA